MDNPGPFVFTFNGGAFSLGAAGTFVGDWVYGIEGALALSLQAKFASAGAGAATLYIQTSLDQGQTAVDVAAFSLAQANKVAVANLSALDKANPFVPAQQSLAADTIQDGVLGDRVRAVLVASAPYSAGASLSIFGCAR